MADTQQQQSALQVARAFAVTFVQSVDAELDGSPMKAMREEATEQLMEALQQIESPQTR